MTLADALAVAHHLKTVPAIDNKVPESARNIRAVERWVRLMGGGLLILLGLSLGGRPGWVSGLAGLALILTAAVRY